MTDSATGAFLRLLAERAVADPAYLGWALRAYAEAEEQSLDDLLRQLGVAESQSTSLILSLRPSGGRLPEMLRAVCERFGADEMLLLSVLRQVEVLESLREGAVSPTADAGLLMAARMRDESTGSRRVSDESETNPESGRHSEGEEGTRAC